MLSLPWLFVYVKFVGLISDAVVPIIAPIIGQEEASVCVLLVMLIVVMAGHIATLWIVDKIFGTKLYAYHRAYMFGTREDLGRLDPW